MSILPLYHPPQVLPPQATQSTVLYENGRSALQFPIATLPPGRQTNGLSTLAQTTLTQYPLPQAASGTRPYLTFQDLRTVPPADVLVVLAHPDDEIFLSATAARLAKEGKRVQFVYVTNGKAGEDVSGRNLSGNALGDVRSLEASNAVRTLGVQNPPLILDFMDGETGVYPEALKEQLRAILLRTRPKSVLLFNAENGVTGHPDHKNVSNFVDDVLETIAAGATTRDQADQGKLTDLLNNSAIYQVGLSETAFKHFRQFFPPENTSWQGLQSVPDVTVNLRVPVSPQTAQQKAVSHRQHQSQYRENDFRQFAGFYQQYPYEEFIKYQIQSNRKLPNPQP